MSNNSYTPELQQVSNPSRMEQSERRDHYARHSTSQEGIQELSRAIFPTLQNSYYGEVYQDRKLTNTNPFKQRYASLGNGKEYGDLRASVKESMRTSMAPLVSNNSRFSQPRMSMPTAVVQKKESQLLQEDENKAKVGGINHS